MKPLVIIVVAGLAVAGFVGGRITASRSVGRKTETSVFADVVAENVSAASGGSVTSSGRSSGGSSGKSGGSPTRIKSVAELRDALKKLPTPRFGMMNQNREAFLLRERLDLLGVKEITTLVQEYMQEELVPLDRQGMRMLFETMAEKDPEAAWKLAATLQPPLRDSALSAAMAGLTEKFPDTALVRLDSIEDERLRRSLKTSLLNSMAEDDPSRALKLALADPAQEKDTVLIRRIFENWARSDWKTAQAALTGLDEGTLYEAREIMALVMNDTDPAAAWKFVIGTGKLPPAGHMGVIYQTVIRQWAQNDPQAALQAALTMQNNDEQNPGYGQRNYCIRAALEGWADSDSNAAFQYVINSSDPDILVDGINALSKRPGSDYAQFFDALIGRGPEDGTKFRNALSSLVYTWLDKSPREAAAAIAQLPPEDNQLSYERVAQMWMQKGGDKNEPIQWLASLPPGKARSEAFGRVFSDWARNDPAAAAAAAAQLPEADRNSINSTIASSWGSSGKDISAAIQWASSQPDSANAIQNVVQSMRDPKQAIALVNSLGLADNVDVMRNVVGNWAAQDLTAASAWVRQLPEGKIRDTALSSVANRYVGDAPETAVAWAMAINDPASRTSSLENIVRQWKRYDTKAAEAWVASSNLPAETKNKLLGK